MSDYATKEDVKEIVSEAVSDITAVMSQFANDVNKRFDKVEKRLDEHDAKFDRLLNTIDGFVSRIDKYETELAARDHKIDRLERWIEEIADKTGVKLTV